MAPETWIFLRGLAREAAHWGEFREEFNRALPDSRPVCVDLPGNGEFWTARSPLSVSVMAEGVRAQTRPDGRPAYLLAISLGAMVAIEWASHYPHEIAGMVLISPSVGRLSPLHQRLSFEALPLVARSFLTANRRRRERLILKLTSQRPEWPESVVDRLVEIQGRHPVTRMNALRQLFAAARYALPLARPRMPVLLLNSLGDKLVSPACCQALSRQWQAPLETHPVAGHDLPLDDPQWVVQRILAWRAGPLNQILTRQVNENG